MKFCPKGYWQISKIVLALLFLTVNFTPSYLFAKEQALDVAIIMDASSSMNKNDPTRLRIEAAKLFVALLSRNDRVALISFSGRAYPITPFLSLNDRKNEQKVLKLIDQLVANGKYTNLHDALLQGYELFSRKTKSNNAKHIILLSDGKMDLGNEERNLSLLEKTLTELTPKLANADIKVHTVAFTKKSYIPLLKIIAQDTHGQFVFLKQPKDIHQVFENLFERTKLPEMLSLSEDSFVLDNAVNELTIVASKLKPYSNITLASPDGIDITQARHDKHVKWFSAKKFDLITITNPTKGYWLVKYSEGGNKVYIVSDFKLVASTTKNRAEPGSPLQIQAHLSKNNKKITRKALLRSTTFKTKVTSPTGAVIENQLVDDGSEIGSERNDGIYGISYSFDAEGTYKVEVTATGQTFDRKKALFIDVISTNPTLPFKKITTARLKLTEIKKQQEIEASLIAEQAQIQHEKEQAEKETSPPALEEKLEPEHELTPPHDPDNDTTAEENNPDEFNWIFAISIFFIFLGTLSGGAYYYFIYRPKNKAKKTTDNQTPPTQPPSKEKEEFEHMSDSTRSVDLDLEESISSALSELEIDESLEDELSSILETEMEKLK